MADGEYSTDADVVREYHMLQKRAEKLGLILDVGQTFCLFQDDEDTKGLVVSEDLDEIENLLSGIAIGMKLKIKTEYRKAKKKKK